MVHFQMRALSLRVRDVGTVVTSGNVKPSKNKLFLLNSSFTFKKNYTNQRACGFQWYQFWL